MTYREWNLALGRHFFREERSGRTVHLAVDAEELLRAAQGVGQDFQSAEEARADFVEAVKAHLGRGEWPNSGALWNGYPCCIGLLAIQVLAVTDMAEDEEWTSKAYWPRLQQILGHQGNTSGIPKTLGYHTHDALWLEHLAGWANARCNKNGSLGFLGLPPVGSGHWHVRLPISQALLRRADIERLGILFEEVGFRPYERDVPLRRILSMLETYRDSSQWFGPHARRVLEDLDRLEPAARQVAAALAEWDGALKIRGRTRAARSEVRLWAEVAGRREPRFEAGLLYRGSPRQDWRRCSEIDFRGAVDRGLSGKAWMEGGLRLAYRPASPSHPPRFLLVLDDATNYFVERRRAGAGERVLLLVQEALASRLIRGLAEVASPGSMYEHRSNRLPGLPKNWAALQFQVVQHLPDALPHPWAEFLAPDLATLKLAGGLRMVARRGVWMEGAGPRLEVGGTSVDFVVVRHDGEVSQVRLADGSSSCSAFQQEGYYEVWLPGEEWRILRFSVRKPRRLGPAGSCHGWRFDEGAWPCAAEPVEGQERPFACGLRVSGPLRESDEPEQAPGQRSESELFMELMLRHQGHSLPGSAWDCVKASEGHPNALIRHLGRLVRLGHLQEAGRIMKR